RPATGSARRRPGRMRGSPRRPARRRTGGTQPGSSAPPRDGGLHRLGQLAVEVEGHQPVPLAARILVDVVARPVGRGLREHEDAPHSATEAGEDALVDARHQAAAAGRQREIPPTAAAALLPPLASRTQGRALVRDVARLHAGAELREDLADLAARHVAVLVQLHAPARDGEHAGGQDAPRLPQPLEALVAAAAPPDLRPPALRRRRALEGFVADVHLGRRVAGGAVGHAAHDVTSAADGTRLAVQDRVDGERRRPVEHLGRLALPRLPDAERGLVHRLARGERQLLLLQLGELAVEDAAGIDLDAQRDAHGRLPMSARTARMARRQPARETKASLLVATTWPLAANNRQRHWPLRSW